MTTHEFRKAVKARWPHVRISIRSVGFMDLARASAQCLTVEGEKAGELALINALAKDAGILPDRNARFYS